MKKLKYALSFSDPFFSFLLLKLFFHAKIFLYFNERCLNMYIPNRYMKVIDPNLLTLYSLSLELWLYKWYVWRYIYMFQMCNIGINNSVLHAFKL